MNADRTRRLCRLFAAIVLGDWDEVRRLRRAAPAGEPDRAWREAILMVHLFAGFPRNIEALDHISDVGGLGEPEPGEVMLDDDVVSRGAALFDRIYADRAGAVRTHLARHHPDFGAWVAAHAYGRVLSRPGLDAATRELLAVSALAALGQDRQLASHARGAVRCGADPGLVEAVLDELPPTVPPDRLERSRAIVRRFVRGPQSR